MKQMKKFYLAYHINSRSLSVRDDDWPQTVYNFYLHIPIYRYQLSTLPQACAADKITFLVSTIIIYNTYLLISPILVENPFHILRFAIVCLVDRQQTKMTKDTWAVNLSLTVK